MTTVMVIAGEVSGDLLGAPLVEALKAERSDLKFIGVAGENMQKTGMKSLFPMEELSLMGITEVLPHIPHLLKRRDELVEIAKKENVQVLITIDAPDFCLRVAKKMKKKLGIPCIHYVSPSVWAWRKGRAGKMAKYLDQVLALFPFEPKFYQGYGLKCDFVGHPLAERLKGMSPSEPDRIPDFDYIALVPGSRRGIVGRMLPTMLETFQMLKESYPTLKAVIPLSGGGADELIRDMVKNDTSITLSSPEHKFDALKRCKASIATSGTSNLELAMLGLPMVIGYKMSGLTHLIAKCLVKIPYASPVNWVAGEKVVPELIQDDVTVENFLASITPLLKVSDTRLTMTRNLTKVRENLVSPHHLSASESAAKIILKYL